MTLTYGKTEHKDINIHDNYSGWNGKAITVTFSAMKDGERIGFVRLTGLYDSYVDGDSYYYHLATDKKYDLCGSYGIRSNKRIVKELIEDLERENELIERKIRLLEEIAYIDGQLKNLSS